MLSPGVQATPSGMRKATETEKEVMTYLIPIPLLGPVAGLAAKSTAKAVKKYGPDLVKMAKKFWTPVKRQTMKKGDRATDESAFVVFKPGKTKSGSPNMSMKKVTKTEGQRMVAEMNARRLATLGTVAGVLGVAASGGGDSRKRNEEIGEPGTVTDTGDSRKRNEEIEEVVEAKPKPKLVDRKGKSPYSDDSTQDDYALRNKVSTRDKAKEENISDSAAEQNLRRGGPVKKKKAGAAKTKYGMKKGGFTSKGGAYY